MTKRNSFQRFLVFVITLCLCRCRRRRFYVAIVFLAKYCVDTQDLIASDYNNIVLNARAKWDDLHFESNKTQ